MKLSSKRILSGIMIAGDIFMIMIALFLMLDESVILGLMMLGFLAVDIYLTIDYIRALRHRERVESSLRADNERLSRSRRQWSNMNLRRNPPRTKSRPKTAEQPSARKTPQPSAPRPSQEARQNSAPRVIVQPAYQEEEDLSDVLTSPSQQSGQNMHG